METAKLISRKGLKFVSQQIRAEGLESGCLLSKKKMEGTRTSDRQRRKFMDIILDYFCQG